MGDVTQTWIGSGVVGCFRRGINNAVIDPRGTGRAWLLRPKKCRQNRINAARLPFRPRGNPLKSTVVSVKRPWEAEWALCFSRTLAMPLGEFDSAAKSRTVHDQT